VKAALGRFESHEAGQALLLPMLHRSRWSNLESANASPLVPDPAFAQRLPASSSDGSLVLRRNLRLFNLIFGEPVESTSVEIDSVGLSGAIVFGEHASTTRIDDSDSIPNRRRSRVGDPS